MEHLLAQNTYACGTVWSNREDLPPCSKNKLRQGEKVIAHQKTNSYLENGMIRERFLSYWQMYCQVSQPVLFCDKGTAVISISRSLMWQMFTRLTWEVLTELINFILFLTLLMVRESEQWSTSGFILRSNWSMVSHRGKENEGPKSLNNILSPEKPMFQGSESVSNAVKPTEEHQKVTKVETRFECSLCKVALWRTTSHNEFHDQAEWLTFDSFLQ